MGSASEPSSLADFGGEVLFLLLDAFAEPKADKAGAADGATNFAFSILDCLADRLRSEVGDSRTSQIARLYQLVLLRLPSDWEATLLRAYLDKHGLANTCRLLLNSNEFMFVN